MAEIKEEHLQSLVKSIIAEVLKKDQPSSDVKISSSSNIFPSIIDTPLNNKELIQSTAEVKQLDITSANEKVVFGRTNSLKSSSQSLLYRSSLLFSSSNDSNNSSSNNSNNGHSVSLQSISSGLFSRTGMLNISEDSFFRLLQDRLSIETMQMNLQTNFPQLYDLKINFLDKVFAAAKSMESDVDVKFSDIEDIIPFSVAEFVPQLDTFLEGIKMKRKVRQTGCIIEPDNIYRQSLLNFLLSCWTSFGNIF